LVKGLSRKTPLNASVDSNGIARKSSTNDSSSYSRKESSEFENLCEENYENFRKSIQSDDSVIIGKTFLLWL
jgi:hypothetical protein